MPIKLFRNEQRCVCEKLRNDVLQMQRSVNSVEKLIRKIDKRIRSLAGRSWSDKSQDLISCAIKQWHPRLNVVMKCCLGKKYLFQLNCWSATWGYFFYFTASANLLLPKLISSLNIGSRKIIYNTAEVTVHVNNSKRQKALVERLKCTKTK